MKSATLSEDGKTVTLKIDNLQPVMQMKIAYNLKAADGAKVQNAIYNTINVVTKPNFSMMPGTMKFTLSIRGL